MKKYLPLLIIPFTVCADTCTLYQEGGGEWRIVCEGNGIVTRYEDVTNEVYVIANCEQLKSSLLSSAEYIEEQAALNQQEASQASRAAADLQVGIDSSNIWMSDIYTNSWYLLVDGANDSWQYAGRLKKAAQNLQNTIDTINCGSCPTNVASGGGSGGSCCDVDFTEIIDRLIVAEQQRAAISNQIAHISHYLGVVTNQLAYNNFLLEHGFHGITNAMYTTEDNLASMEREWLYYHSNGWGVDDLYYFETFDGVYKASELLYMLAVNNAYSLGSINNFYHDVVDPSLRSISNNVSIFRRDFSSYSDETTNFFSFFRGEIGVRGVLEDWTSEQVDGTYHDFLTNHYINVVRGGSLSGYQVEKTNWFARIETLLASLVFLDSSDTNSYNEAAASVSNGISRVKDEFNNKLDNVSSASSTQIELVSDIEKSMYESLQSFSKAFSSASLPSTVQLLYVRKSSGAKSLSSSDTVDVTVPVEGNLMDFVEIIRSCTTLCWVFFGLWFMFKFSVWTVKKIYMLIRYIIDFFNMVAGGK